MDIIFIWIKFIFCTCIILFSGKRVAKYGDAIAEKTGLSGLWIGLILVSVATSLPEIFTGFASVVFLNAPDLAIGNLFGANTYNLLNIAILDAVSKGAPLLSSISSGQLLTAILSLIPVSLAAVGIFLGPKLYGVSLVIFLSYLISVRTIFKFEKKQKGLMKELREEEKATFKYNSIRLKDAFSRYIASAAVIAAAGIWLAFIGEELSGAMKLGENFVGSIFLGLATTLPEITVSIAAIRIGAKELAVANMLGSNLFNMSIIFLNDILYKKAPLFNVLSQQHIFTAFMVILMTGVVISGLILKPRKKTIFGLSWYSLVLIAIFTAGTFLNFTQGSR